MIATKELAPILAPMVKKLWPEHELGSLTRILENYIEDSESAVFADIADGRYTGVALCTIRHDYVEGCDTSPVGYLEGIYVGEEYRRNGIAKKLCAECEDWAKSMGCSEFASDCELTNTTSLQFHLGIGFEEQNRLICFKKTL